MTSATTTTLATQLNLEVFVTFAAAMVIPYPVHQETVTPGAANACSVSTTLMASTVNSVLQDSTEMQSNEHAEV